MYINTTLIIILCLIAAVAFFFFIRSTLKKNRLVEKHEAVIKKFSFNTEYSLCEHVEEIISLAWKWQTKTIYCLLSGYGECIMRGLRNKLMAMGSLSPKIILEYLEKHGYTYKQEWRLNTKDQAGTELLRKIWRAAILRYLGDCQNRFEYAFRFMYSLTEAPSVSDLKVWHEDFLVCQDIQRSLSSLYFIEKMIEEMESYFFQRVVSKIEMDPSITVNELNEIESILKSVVPVNSNQLNNLIVLMHDYKKKVGIK
ncbi:MAG TPA: hypothetical protein VLB02_01265 [Candidatus Paceibacterota bacterium]|nr:hypothetical protein [Candidatus Paceibacterota bacterium]